MCSLRHSWGQGGGWGGWGTGDREEGQIASQGLSHYWVLQRGEKRKIYQDISFPCPLKVGKRNELAANFKEINVFL